MKKYLKLIFRFLVTVSLIFYLLNKTNIEELLTILLKVNLPIFLSASVLYLISSYVSTIRWSIFIPQRFYFKRSDLFSLYMIGCFFNTFLPGIMGGDVLKIYYLRRQLGLKDAIISVFMDRYTGFFALLFLGFLFFMIFWWKMPENLLVYLVPLMFMAFILISLTLLKIGRLPFIRDIKMFIINFTKVDFIKALVYSLAIQIIVIASVYLIFLGLNLRVNVFELTIYLTVIITLTTLPISISGIGIREWAFVLFFGNSIGYENALAVSLLWFMSVVVASVWGGFEYLRFKDSINMHYK